MIVGVPKEIKDNEYRVAMTPGGAHQLAKLGHQVLVQAGAGAGSGFPDGRYEHGGATIVDTAAGAWEAELVVKVKEPQPEEYAFLRPDLTLFTYLHLAADEALTREMMARELTGIAYETVELPNGSLPLLTPMSEVSGRMAVQVGAHYMERENGGRGKLLSGVPGVRPADVDEVMHGRLITLSSNPLTIAEAVRRADLLIGAVLIKGAKAPKLVTRDMVSTMAPGSVIVDVAVDQGGCIETTHPTTHSDPIYFVDGVLHYCVANMPGVVPRTSTYALGNATLPYMVKLAEMGVRDALREDDALARGVNTYRGVITYPGVAEAFDLEYTPLDTLL
jgi:alanine dehydrogenase